MNLYDFLIIYLACGAPLGVYYFLQNRHKPDRQKLFLKSFFSFIIWMPLALRLITKNRFSRKRFNNNFDADLFSDVNIEKNIQSTKTRLQKALFEIDPSISIYEVKEIFDRYVSFELFGQIDAQNSQSELSENEIFRIAGHNNSELATICLQRRNRKMFSFHQTLARMDFLDMLAGKPKLAASALEFVSLLNDLETKEAIEKMFELETQTGRALDVKDAEKEIWNSETRKPILIKTRLKAMTATMSLREKD
jgi:hypothetical protein